MRRFGIAADLTAEFFSTQFLFAVGLQRRMEITRLSWVTSWFAIGMATDLFFGLWARRKVLREFRNAAAQSLDAEKPKEGIARTAMNFLKDVAAAIATLRTPGRAAGSKTLLRRYRWIWSVAAVLVLEIGWFAWHRFSLARQLQARLDALRAANYPVTISDIDRRQPAVPDNENAALKILEAAAAITVDPATFAQVQSLVRGATLTPDWKQKFGRLLPKNAAALRILHQAASLPRSRFPVDWTNSSAFLVPHLGKIHQLVPLLRAEALMHSDSGNPARAVESIIASFGVAHSLSTDFNTSAEWVRLECLSLTCSSLERLLTHHSLSELDLKKLLTLVAGAENEAKFGRVLAGQRALDLAAYYLPPERLYQAASPNINRQQANILGLLFGLLRITGIREADSLFYLDGVDQWIAITPLAYPERLAKAKDLDWRFEAQLARRPHFLLSRKLSALGETEVSWAERVAYLRAAQTALAVECYRGRNNGRLPETLEESVPRFLSAVPNDPFDGGPLRYKRLENGYATYSIGPDGKDDRGLEVKRRSRGTGEEDVTFVVGR